MTRTAPCINTIASAVRECDVRSITGVPGYPVTELMEHLIAEAHAKWCINEKVAMEIALGASACGSRSLVIVKHVGMNILADPLITASTHTTGAGTVIIAGDDPMAAASQNEQDSRYWGMLSEVPVLDPNPTNLYNAVCEGYRIAEAVRTPVIVRVTDRLLQSESTINENRTQNESKSHLFDRSIWEYTMHGRHQLFHRNAYPLMEDLSETSDLNRSFHEKTASSCIISSGYASVIVESIMRKRNIEIPHLSLSFVNPLPVKRITDFIGDQRALIIEETEPVIENQLRSYNILGRRSGHIPYGGLTEEDILFAVENIDKDEIALDIDPETLKNRGYTRSICEDCPFIPVYEAVKNIKNDFFTKNRVKTALRARINSTSPNIIEKNNILIAGDMGCSIRTAPTGVVDLAYSLGGAIGIASGMPGKGIAITGDFGLVHSGLQALIDAEFSDRDVLVIVLNNTVSAMTGGQSVPDPAKIIRACCSDVTIIDETADTQAVEQLITEKLAAHGVSVIVACGACRRYL